MTTSLGILWKLPRSLLSHAPTPIEALNNLPAHLGCENLFVKRDDCTGLAFGGNKVRQLEFYLGEAVAQGADTILITGAVQSNFVRLAAAAANKLGMECHIQLEDRVPGKDEIYRNSGNVLIDRLLGASIDYYEKGEDEAGADLRIREIAKELKQNGRRPYVIPLAPGHPPHGALGYVVAAHEIVSQIETNKLAIEEIVVASGSGHTHGGLLFGIKALAPEIKVTGICVRRAASMQKPRIQKRCEEIAQLLQTVSPVDESDIHVVDDFLAPGYGCTNPPALEAMELSAQKEGLILDPTYTAKTMAGFIHMARSGQSNMLFIHTGGQPAVFGYEPELTKYFSAAP